MASFDVWNLLRALVLSLALYRNAVVAQAIITEDSYFYGESPPVYPSREFYNTISIHLRL